MKFTYVNCGINILSGSLLSLYFDLYLWFPLSLTLTSFASLHAEVSVFCHMIFVSLVFSFYGGTVFMTHAKVRVI